MIVCVCNGVSDRHIKAAIRSGANSLDALSAELGVGAGCGACRATCGEILEEAGCTASRSCSSMPSMSFASITAIPVMHVTA